MNRYQIETHSRECWWNETDSYREYWCEVWDTESGETVYVSTAEKHDEGKVRVRQRAAAWVRRLSG